MKAADAPAIGTAPLAPESLRWRCPLDHLNFQTTAEIDPVPGVIGQETALEALEFGLETTAPGQNIFVRGLSGTGRMTMLRRLLGDLRPDRADGCDRCYVHNFAEPDRPRLITLPAGKGRDFRRMLDDLADFVRDGLRSALSSVGVAARRRALDQATAKRVTALIAPFEKALNEVGLALVQAQVGPMTQATIFPLVKGKPVAPEEFDDLRERHAVSEREYKRVTEARLRFSADLDRINVHLHEYRRAHFDRLRALLAEEVRALLAPFVRRIEGAFDDEGVSMFLAEVVNDITTRLDSIGEEQTEDFTRKYRANLIREHTDGKPPIIIENVPTLFNLIGVVDREMVGPGAFRSDHLMIRAGSLLRADGGYLLLDARDLLTEPGAWKAIVRTLRTGCLEITPSELALPWLGQMLKPKPIEVSVKVVLVGDEEIHYLLCEFDPDFGQFFKVLADFDSVIPRRPEGIRDYAGVLARIGREENLPPFSREAVAALVEHGARIAARGDKLTARFGRLADLAREAAFVAGKAGRKLVEAEDVAESIRRSRRRADLPLRHFRDYLADGTIHVETTGAVVGQINGLSVMEIGPITCGFPARITATIAPGSAGVINIEREAELSGAIHTKGFYILGGLLRHLLGSDHPHSFDGSVAFEQSYGGIDGDSASGAEICCLLSALTGVPVRQDLAMTGAIDQRGNLLSIGAVNEKIEGFYDVCLGFGLSGTQGVIIPRANTGDLMLRPDVVEAAAEGRFHIYAVETVMQAMELFTGMAAGARDEKSNYPDGSLLTIAVRKSREFWVLASETEHKKEHKKKK